MRLCQAPSRKSRLTCVIRKTQVIEEVNEHFVVTLKRYFVRITQYCGYQNYVRTFL